MSNSHKSTQKGLAPSYGLRCAQVPSLRSCSVGTPPRAIHGPSRLSRHPCRSTHSTEPPLGLPEGGRSKARSKADQEQIKSFQVCSPYKQLPGYCVSQPLLQCRVIRVLLLKLCQQYLHILQLPGFFPVTDQQHPRLAIGRLALQQFL